MQVLPNRDPISVAMYATRHFFLLILAATVLSCGSPKDVSQEDCYPPIWPDYKGVTIPVNIAPLNFSVADTVDCKSMFLTVSDTDGKQIMSLRGQDHIDFPLRKWKRMLAENVGTTLRLSLALEMDGSWKRFKDFTYEISSDEIDYGLTYRLVLPGYQAFGKMGIYERNLSTFDERELIDNRMLEAGCVNCHTANKTDPSSISLHVRGKHSATFMRHGGKDEILDTKTDTTGGFFVYPYWHPSDDYIAYSVNKTRQAFYMQMQKRIEVYDESSDVIVYKPESHEILLCDQLMRKDKFETYPAFSADGKTLFFCVSDAADMPDNREKMQYSLCSISFDPQTGTFGERVDTLVSGPANKLSFATPRPSYDGKYVLLAGASFGTFPIWHKEADLYLYDIQTAELRNVSEVNSDDTESFHNWTKDSKWIVFSSRRGTGLYTRLYIAHLDENGQFGRPFLLPQKNPLEYYDRLVYSYNTPDFTGRPVDLNIRKVHENILSDERTSVYVR